MPFTLRSVAASHVGLVRRNNQDSGYAGDDLLVVADGMGGHAGGDVASSIAVAALVGLDSEAAGPDALQQLSRAITGAQDTIMAAVREEPALKGMGTTVTAVLRSGDRLVLAHIGDSRAYLLRHGELTQVTTDHTFVQMLVDEGRISPEEAENHPQRSVIMRVLGDVDAEVELDTSVRAAAAGDRWLLCSDGLSGPVSDETIAETMSERADLAECARVLVDLALRAGGPDNITCVMADVVDDRSSGTPRPPSVVGAAAVDRSRDGEKDASTAATRAAALIHSSPTQPIPTSAGGAPGQGENAAPTSTGPGGGTSAGPAAAPARGPGGAQRTAVGDPGARRSTEPAAAQQEEPALRPRGRRRGRRSGARWLVALVVAVVVLGGGTLAVRAWLDRQYFVGAAGGDVAIYTGLPQDVGPVTLSQVVQRSSTAVVDLPPIYRQRVQESISARDLRDARRIVADLEDSGAAAAPPEEPAPAPAQGATPEAGG